jgi:hypothetical protein
MFALEQSSQSDWLLCFGPIVLFLFFIWIIIDHRRAYKKIADKLQVEAEDYFSTLRHGLRRWRQDAFQDFALPLEMDWLHFASKSHGRGTLKSLSDPGGSEWVVFEIKFRGRTGFVDIRTKQDVYLLEFNPADHPSQILVYVNDDLLGTLTNSRITLTLTENNTNVIGTYVRFQGKSRRRWGWKPRYGLVKMADRQIIKLHNEFLAASEYPQYRDKPEPVFQDLSWRPTQMEENWLMALVGWEIKHTIENIRTRSLFHGY